MSDRDPLSYYAQHGPVTEPGRESERLVGLPTDLLGLSRVVQGLLIHPKEAGLYAVTLTAAQKRDQNLRTIAERLQALDDGPLTEARAPRDRQVGNCRDFAVLFCALLRHQGVAARARAGFAVYLSPKLYYDHWITEVWDAAGSRWRRVDPQIDAVQKAAYKIKVDTLDIPAGQFYTGGEAWQASRAGTVSSGRFGANSRVRGLPFVRSQLLRDFVALNKVEVLAGDEWWDLGMSQKKDTELTPEDKALLDRLAALMAGGPEVFDALRAAYEGEPRFSVPVRQKLAEAGPDRPAGLPALRPGPASALQALAGQPAPRAPRRRAARAAEPAPFDLSSIFVKGAAQHNLKHIDVTLPRHKLVVLTGVSGSGKSSLAFDTLYAEGQRRYVESLSPFVRRYMDQMEKPKVDYIMGLSPAISIEQKTVGKNPRSTVGTITEVLDYLRLLFSRVGTQHCPNCGQALEPRSAQEIADLLAALPGGTRFQLAAPLGSREEAQDTRALLEQARRDGYTRVRIDGDVTPVEDALERGKRFAGDERVEVVVDRLKVPSAAANGHGEFASRLIDSVETALRAGQGRLRVLVEGGAEIPLTEHNACAHCDLAQPKLSASLFSFNAPTGMCPDCNGLGTQLEVDLNRIIDQPHLSLLDGASRWYGNLRKGKGKYWTGNLEAMARHYKVDLEKPWNKLPERFKQAVLYGSGDEKIHSVYQSETADGEWKGESVRPVKGIVYHINRLFRATKSDGARRYYMGFMGTQPCATCQGERLNAAARLVTAGGQSFSAVNRMTIERAHAWVQSLLPTLNLEQQQIAGEVLKELRDRLQFMLSVGLHYLSLDRPAPTLSGGEGQRIRLASALGCGLVGVLYILDEPSIGLHARDQRTLLDTLVRLRDMGNTVLVVEHDAETMRAADWLVDMGPGAGILGGRVVAEGTPAQVAADPHSLTGRYLSGALQVHRPPEAPSAPRPPRGWLTLTGARHHNLKGLTVRFPLGTLTGITGVSGSGKSSLIDETLFPALMRALHSSDARPGPFDRLEGLDQIDKVIDITQDPIGRTPRSNPATYVKAFDEIRDVFALTPEARLRGYGADRFSFNVKGGRCEACQGHGQKLVEMHFLPDVWVLCQACKGQRFNRETLSVTYKDRTISDVLAMDVQEALAFFADHPRLNRILQTLHDVGLDYLKLGQSATTLSGGEAQRVKLAKELSRVATGRTLYILDEPTTGLHFADVQRLLDVLHRLVDAGNSVLVIEHNLDVIKTADWIIDLGPEGGAAGGYLLAEGSPEAVAANENSYTGRCLRPLLEHVRHHA